MTEPLPTLLPAVPMASPPCVTSVLEPLGTLGALGEPLDLTEPATALLGLSVPLQPQGPMARAACRESAATGTTR